MTVVTAAAFMARILDPEEFQALVVLLTPSRDRGKFITATAIQSRGRTPFVPRAPAATPATATGSAETTPLLNEGFAPGSVSSVMERSPNCGEQRLR
jgi:hypothetical protein